MCCISAVLKARTETGRSNLTLFFLYLPSPPTTFFLFSDSKAKLLNMDLHKDTVNINRLENIFFLKHPSYGSCSLEMTDNFKALFLDCFVKTVKLLCPRRHFRGATVNLSQARPNILPQFFLPVVSYKSVLKPKI